MTRLEIISAKSRRPDESSDAVVVSFSVAWYEKLLATRFSVVIRKRTPARMQPTWLYFHINAPISSICARARVSSVRKIRREQALSISDSIDLSKEDIGKYIGSDEMIGAYYLDHIELARNPAPVSRLRNHMIYHPPQSFFILAVRGQELIDQLCQFAIGRDKVTIGKR